MSNKTAYGIPILVFLTAISGLWWKSQSYTDYRTDKIEYSVKEIRHEVKEQRDMWHAVDKQQGIISSKLNYLIAKTK